jgi:hypothetical protein
MTFFYDAYRLITGGALVAKLLRCCICSIAHDLCVMLLIMHLASSHAQ